MKQLYRPLFVISLALGLGQAQALPAEEENWRMQLDESALDELQRPPGRIHFEQTVQDLGQIYRGQVVEVHFSFENRGKGPFRIQGVHASCGCTIVDMPGNRLFEPGSSGEITVKLDTTDYLGDFSRTIAVITSDSANRSHVLTLKASIRPELDVQPPIVDFGDVQGDQGAHRSIIIRQLAGKTPFEIERIEHNPKHFDVHWRKDAESWIIDLYLRPGLPSSFIRDGLVVVNNSQHLGQLPIPIRGDIVGKIHHLPAYVEFGAIPHKGLAEQKIRLNGQQKFAITGKRAELLVNGQMISNFDSYLDIKDLSGELAESRQLALKLKNPDELKGSVHGRLILETSDPGQKEIVVNFYAFFQE